MSDSVEEIVAHLERACSPNGPANGRYIDHEHARILLADWRKKKEALDWAAARFKEMDDGFSVATLHALQEPR